MVNKPAAPIRVSSHHSINFRTIKTAIMKKTILAFVLALFAVSSFSQDKMTKKMENKTDKMNKKMENKGDKMNKKIDSTAKKTSTKVKKTTP